MDCVYCELPEVKKRMICENDYAWAFPTNIPIVPGHTLLVPKRCVKTFEELNDKELKGFLELRVKLKEALIKTFDPYGFNYAFNEGEQAGQSVPHLHLHILPRKNADDGIINYEPRKFLYRPGSIVASKEEELQQVAELIKENL